MDLEQQSAGFRAEFERTATAGRAALYDANVEERRARFPLQQALAVGDTAPDFSLPNGHDRDVSLADALRQGAAVVTFYRGGWCPCCNMQLRAYQQAMAEITGLGVKLIAISPQLAGRLAVERDEERARIRRAERGRQRRRPQFWPGLCAAGGASGSVAPQPFKPTRKTVNDPASHEELRVAGRRIY